MAMSECGLSTNDRRLRKRTLTDREELEVQDGGTIGKTRKYIKPGKKDTKPKDDTSEIIYPWMLESRHKQKGILCSFCRTEQSVCKIGEVAVESIECQTRATQLDCNTPQSEIAASSY